MATSKHAKVTDDPYAEAGPSLHTIPVEILFEIVKQDDSKTLCLILPSVSSILLDTLPKITAPAKPAWATDYGLLADRFEYPGLFRAFVTDAPPAADFPSLLDWLQRRIFGVTKAGKAKRWSSGGYFIRAAIEAGHFEQAKQLFSLHAGGLLSIQGTFNFRHTAELCAAAGRVDLLQLIYPAHLDKRHLTSLVHVAAQKCRFNVLDWAEANNPTASTFAREILYANVTASAAVVIYALQASKRLQGVAVAVKLGYRLLELSHTPQTVLSSGHVHPEHTPRVEGVPDLQFILMRFVTYPEADVSIPNVENM